MFIFIFNLLLSVTVIKSANIRQRILRSTNADNDLLVAIEDENKAQYLERNFNANTYKFGYEVGSDGQFHHENRGPNGITYGCYGHIDPNKNLQATHYVADNYGYRVVEPNFPIIIYKSVNNDEVIKEIQTWSQSYFPKGCGSFSYTFKSPQTTSTAIQGNELGGIGQSNRPNPITLDVNGRPISVGFNNEYSNSDLQKVSGYNYSVYQVNNERNVNNMPVKRYNRTKIVYQQFGNKQPFVYDTEFQFDKLKNGVQQVELGANYHTGQNEKWNRNKINKQSHFIENKRKNNILSILNDSEDDVVNNKKTYSKNLVVLSGHNFYNNKNNENLKSIDDESNKNWIKNTHNELKNKFIENYSITKNNLDVSQINDNVNINKKYVSDQNLFQNVKNDIVNDRIVKPNLIKGDLNLFEGDGGGVNSYNINQLQYSNDAKRDYVENGKHKYLNNIHNENNLFNENQNVKNNEENLGIFINNHENRNDGNISKYNEEEILVNLNPRENFTDNSIINVISDLNVNLKPEKNLAPTFSQLNADDQNYLTNNIKNNFSENTFDMNGLKEGVNIDNSIAIDFNNNSNNLSKISDELISKVEPQFTSNMSDVPLVQKIDSQYITTIDKWFDSKKDSDLNTDQETNFAEHDGIQPPRDFVSLSNNNVKEQSDISINLNNTIKNEIIKINEEQNILNKSNDGCNVLCLQQNFKYLNKTLLLNSLNQLTNIAANQTELDTIQKVILLQPIILLPYCQNSDNNFRTLDFNSFLPLLQNQSFVKIPYECATCK